MSTYPADNAYGQNTVHYQTPAPAPAPEKKRLSKWWPLSFFILTILFVVVGGGLLGSWVSSVSTYRSSVYPYRYYYRQGNNGLFYGGVACFVLAGLFKLVAWILLVVWLVQRSRARRNPSVVYVQQPVGYYPPPAQPQPVYNGPGYHTGVSHGAPVKA